MLELKDEVPTLVIADSTNSRVPRHMYKRANIVMIVVGTNCVNVLVKRGVQAEDPKLRGVLRSPIARPTRSMARSLSQSPQLHRFHGVPHV